MAIYYGSQRYNLKEYRLESEFERDIVEQATLLFGEKSIYIDAKRKIETKSLGGSIPDGFLFDFSDVLNPTFYIVEVELAKHDFLGHIYRQITRFIGFFNNQASITRLVDKLYAIIVENDEIRTQFVSFIGQQELYKSIKDIVENSQNILLVIDELKPEIEETIEILTEWNTMVHPIVVKRYSNGKDEMFSMTPEFEIIEYVDEQVEKEEKSEFAKDYTEEYHLNKSKEHIQPIYLRIKKAVEKRVPDAQFKIHKKYIGLVAEKRIAQLYFFKKDIKIVLMKNEEEVEQELRHHEVIPHSESIKAFWNADSCEIRVDTEEHVKEVIDLLVGMCQDAAEQVKAM